MPNESELKIALDQVEDPWGPRQDFMSRGFELGYASAIGEVVEWLQTADEAGSWAARIAQRFAPEPES